jgi:hypothetical protein
LAVVGVDAVLDVAGRAVTVPDPSGGTCNAAGDFDRLIPVDPKTYPTLSRIDPWAYVTFDAEDMAAMLPEIEQLLAIAQQGPERRGLLRLRALAEHGQHHPTSRLVIRGD